MSPDPLTPQLQPGMLVAFSLSSDGLSELFMEHLQVSGKLRNMPFKKYLGVVLDTSVYDPLGVVKDGLHQFSRPPPENVRIAMIGSSESKVHGGGDGAAAPMHLIVHQIYKTPRRSSIIVTAEELERFDREAVSPPATPIRENSSQSSPGVYANTLSSPSTSEMMGAPHSCVVFDPLIDVWTDLEKAGTLSDPSEFADEVNATKRLVADWFSLHCQAESPDFSHSGTETQLATAPNPLSKDEGIVLVTLGLGAALTAGLLWSRYARR